MTTPRHLARREDDSDHNTQGEVVGVAPYQLEGRRRRAVRHVLMSGRESEDDGGIKEGRDTLAQQMTGGAERAPRGASHRDQVIRENPASRGTETSHRKKVR